MLLDLDPIYIMFVKIAKKFAFEIRIEIMGFLTSREQNLAIGL